MKPISIEFYGLPGCGKSTLSHVYAEALRHKGLRVWEPSYEIDRKYSPMMRKVVKLMKLISFSIFHYGDYKEVCSIVKGNGYSGIPALLQKANIVQKALAYRRVGNYDVMIWDEGAVQAALSLAVNESCNADENEKRIMQITGDICYCKVHTYVDKETALERMNGRSTNDSRVEKMGSVEEQMDFLSKFEEACNSISEEEGGREIKCLKLDTVTCGLEDLKTKLMEELAV